MNTCRLFVHNTQATTNYDLTHKPYCWDIILVETNIHWSKHLLLSCIMLLSVSHTYERDTLLQTSPILFFIFSYTPTWSVIMIYCGALFLPSVYMLFPFFLFFFWSFQTTSSAISLQVFLLSLFASCVLIYILVQ